jgi:hypothetical protein
MEIISYLAGTAYRNRLNMQIGHTELDMGHWSTEQKNSDTRMLKATWRQIFAIVLLQVQYGASYEE